MKKSELDPFDSESENRYAAFEEMRSEGPVHDVLGGRRFVVGQRAVEEGLKSVESFVGSFGNTGQAAEEDTVMAAIPEPRHGKIRKLFNSALAYHHSSQVEPFLRSYAAQCMDATVARSARDGEVEIMESFARPIPSAIIAKVLGIPDERSDDFARWSDEILSMQGVDEESTLPLGMLHPEFGAYLKGQISSRVASSEPPDDMITRLLQAEVDGERLSERAALTQTIFLIIAGNETTRNLIGNLIHRLATDRKLFEQVAADRELIPMLIEESLRIDSPVQLLARTCTRDLEIDGVQIRAGDRVLHSISSANRDESVYSDADQFRIDRPKPRDHVAFGAGPHVCPGAFLARLEAQVAMETLFEHVAGLELAPGYVFDPNPVFWALGPRTLRVQLKVS